VDDRRNALRHGRAPLIHHPKDKRFVILLSQSVFECIWLGKAKVLWCFLCHGFPELWYSWRHQLSPLAAAGFHAVAADMRGYGQTDRPETIDQYTLLHLIGDMAGLLDALGHETAVIAGHDWGAPVAWHAALLRPDRFRAVIGLSVPFIPRGPDYPSKSFPESEVNEAMLEFLRRLITVRQKAVSRMLRSRPDYLVCSLIISRG
jgi:pimeloyl-ACP methyl ester carboxylesterase